MNKQSDEDIDNTCDDTNGFQLSKSLNFSEKTKQKIKTLLVTNNYSFIAIVISRVIIELLGNIYLLLN